MQKRSSSRAIRMKCQTGIALLFSVLTTLGCATHWWAPAPDPEEPWEKYDNAVKEALTNQRYDLAEENVIMSAKAFQAKNGGPGHGDCIQLSKIYILQGKYAKAAQERIIYFQACKNQLSLTGIVLHYCYLGDIYLAQGNYQLALENYNLSRQSAQYQTLSEPQNGKDFIYLDPYLGYYYIQQGEYENAKRCFKEISDYLIKKGAHGFRIAQANNGLGLAYYYDGEEKEAEQVFQGAAGLNANAFVGFPHDLAISLTMLGRIAEHRGQSDQAFKFYQSARAALHMYRLVDKLDDADLWNQFGRFQLTQGKPEESGKAYNEAITLRQETATATHPNCADAFKGLADVSAYKGDLTSATLQATKALEILDASVVPTHPRTAQAHLRQLETKVRRNSRKKPIKMGVDFFASPNVVHGIEK